MSTICRDNVYGTLIAVHARRSRMGSQCNYYKTVSHGLLPNVVAIRFVGQDQDEALHSFQASRENAVAAFNQSWWAGP